MKKEEWRQRTESLEELEKSKNIGYTMQRNNGWEAQIRESVSKASKALEKTLRIGGGYNHWMR